MNTPQNGSLHYLLAEEQLAEGQAVKIAFGGTSMLPTLRASDRIVLTPLCEEPQVGDVLLFHYAGHRVVHRLVRREGEVYVMRGDNNIGVERVLRSDLLALVTSVERRDGRVVESSSRAWRWLGRLARVRYVWRGLLVRTLGSDGRRRLRPWYFGLLAFLMWAPLNGLGLPLDNYVFGLRFDHLLHASVYLLCPLFLWDLYGRLGKAGRRWAVWGSAVAVGLLTEGVQYLLPWRGFDINDLVANALGVTLGWLAVRLMKRGA